MALSEDIKLSIITALNLLITKTTILILNQMYNDVDCKSVGYLIYVCIEMIKNEKMNILRFALYYLIIKLNKFKLDPLAQNLIDTINFKIILIPTRFF